MFFFILIPHSVIRSRTDIHLSASCGNTQFICFYLCLQFFKKLCVTLPVRGTLDLTPITVVGCLPNAHFPADLRYGHLSSLHKVEATVQLLHKPRQPRRISGVPACQQRKVGKHRLPMTCRRVNLNKTSCCITSARTVPHDHTKGNASLSLMPPTLPSAASACHSECHSEYQRHTESLHGAVFLNLPRRRCKKIRYRSKWNNTGFLSVFS